MDDQFPELDKTLHQATRFAVLAFLVRADGEASFIEACRAIGIKHAGALSAHARVLENAGHVEMRKSFIGRKPHTTIVLTAKGRKAFAKHKAKLEAIAAPPSSAMGAPA